MRTQATKSQKHPYLRKEFALIIRKPGLFKELMTPDEWVEFCRKRL